MKITSFLVPFLFLFILKGHAQKPIVLLDYYYNNEYKINQDGSSSRYHYIWEDTTMNGYSIWGEIFKNKGANLEKLTIAPNKQNLSKAAIYIIADPDTQKESPHPNFLQMEEVKIISEWVYNGGVLVLLANDSANAELPHFNSLANKFGIHFTNKTRNAVIKDISVGTILIPKGNRIFKKAKQLYLKGISTIQINHPALPCLQNDGDVIMAMSKYGKGSVFAVGDPWIYNEYINNDRLSPLYQNEQAAKELTDWLLKQIPKNK
ncbi:MAG: DUF4350 domain-containing protein [Bacteroidetes bacterium]|nr:DUF4350 domain-containing protein [Bacteroidota bacterium]